MQKFLCRDKAIAPPITPTNMKFKVNQQDLSANLSLVSLAVPSRPSHPVLANVLVRAEGDRMHLTAFDLSLGINVSFPAEVEEPESVALPAKLFSDIISRLPDGELAISVKFEDEAAIAHIKSKSGKYQVRGMRAGEFPEFPEVEGEAIALPASELMGAIGSCLFAVSSDETKQVLTGIHLTLGHGILEAASTDGHRLAVAPQAIDEAIAVEATIPGKALHELQKIAAGAEVISLRMDERQAVFEAGDRILTTRLIEGQYPNYRQLFPKSFGVTVMCDRKLLLSALDRVMVLAEQKNGVVKFDVDAESQELVLSCEAQDVGGAREAIAAAISREGLAIAFNGKYVSEALKAMGGSEVQINLNTATSPVVFEPLGEGKMKALVMPCQIRQV